MTAQTGKGLPLAHREMGLPCHAGCAGTCCACLGQQLLPLQRPAYLTDAVWMHSFQIEELCVLMEFLQIRLYSKHLEAQILDVIHT